MKVPLSADTIKASINEPSHSLNVIHLESTSCEEYELVQSLFQRTIRDVRQQREIFQHSNPLHIIEETASPKSQKAKSNTLTKTRTKSPKHTTFESVAGAEANQVPGVNNSNMGMLPASKDGSLKKNKFQFLNKILNNKNF